MNILKRSNARRGCDECDVTHEPFSCNEDWPSCDGAIDCHQYDDDGIGEEYLEDEEDYHGFEEYVESLLEAKMSDEKMQKWISDLFDQEVSKRRAAKKLVSMSKVSTKEPYMNVEKE